MTDAEIAILSLLAEGPRNDFDLNDQIESRGLRRWTAIGSSSLYYVLDKLEKQGLIRNMRESASGGGRKYRLSTAGMGILQTAMVDLLATPHGNNRLFELGLANLHILKTSQIRTALLNRQQDIRSQIGQIDAALQAEQLQGNSFQALALFSHRLTLLNAELDWLTTFIPQWESQAQPDPVPASEPVEISRSRQVVLPQDPDSVHKAKTKRLSPDKAKTPPAMRTRALSPKKPAHGSDQDPRQED
jgi:DNA-binding PadR family transcriptional regulator